MKTVKRVLCMLAVIIFMVMTVCSVVFATDSSPGPVDEPNEYVSWAYIATMGGATFVTTLIVQFLKMPLDYIWKIPTRFFVYFIALLTMLVAEYITQGGLLFDRAVLIAVNAFLVTIAAMGTYEITFKKLESSG